MQFNIRIYVVQLRVRTASLYRIRYSIGLRNIEVQGLQPAHILEYEI